MARSLSLRSRINSKVIMKQLYSVILFVSAALLITACEIGLGIAPNSPQLPDNGSSDTGLDQPGYGIKPTVPLKRRPIVPTSKLPRPKIIERISWTEAGTLSVALTEDTPAVITIVVRDGSLRSYVVDARTVEITNVPEEEFEMQIDVADERYTVVVD